MKLNSLTGIYITVCLYLNKCKNKINFSDFNLHYSMSLFKPKEILKSRAIEKIYITVCLYLNCFYRRKDTLFRYIYITVCLYLNFINRFRPTSKFIFTLQYVSIYTKSSVLMKFIKYIYLH